MSKFFHKIKGHKSGAPASRRVVDPKDLVDPVLYNGELDLQKYPILNDKKDAKPIEEPENPLNKR